MRILVGHCRYRQPGGEDRYVDQLVDLLSSRHEVGTFLRDNADLDSSVATVARMLASRALRRQAQSAIADFGPDVVHLHNVYPSIGPALHLAARKASVPIVMTVHNYRLRCANGLMFTEGAPCRRCEDGNFGHALGHDCFPTSAQSAAYATVLSAHRYVLRLERLVAAFIAPSAFVAARLRDWGIPAGRIHELPHPAPSLPGSRKDEDGGGGAYGLFLGRLRPEKGPLALVPALRLAGDPPFVFAGDGPLRNELANRVRQAGLVNTRLMGWQTSDAVSELLRRSRYVVMPSRFDEPAGLVALEAMAAGRPLIVSDRGALPEVARDGAALAVPPDDPAALAEAISRLAADDEFGRRLAEVGRALVGTTYAPDAHCRDLETIYQSVL